MIVLREYVFNYDNNNNINNNNKKSKTNVKIIIQLMYYQQAMGINLVSNTTIKDELEA